MNTSPNYDQELIYKLDELISGAQEKHFKVLGKAREFLKSREHREAALCIMEASTTDTAWDDRAWDLIEQINGQ